MKDETVRRFNSRAFVSIMITICFFGLPPTGLMNHLMQNDPVTSSRHAWMAAHNTLSFLFTVFACLHIFMNRHTLLRHTKGLVERLPGMGREAICAALLLAVMLLFGVGHTLLLRS